MGNRHKMKKGGGAMSGREDYSGTGKPNVVKEAAEKKRGGGVDMKVEGGKGKHRVKKARGGAANSTDSPFSSAHRGE